MGQDVFRAIADPARRRILDLLSEGELGVTELLAAFEFSQPALSQHLAVLRDAGLVSVRRAGRRRLYSLAAEPLREVFDWLSPYEAFWRTRLRALGAYLDAEAVVEEIAAQRQETVG